MTIISRTKFAAVCAQCGGTIRKGGDCAWNGEQVLCGACYEDRQILANDLIGGHTSFCIVRTVRGLIRRLVWQ